MSNSESKKSYSVRQMVITAVCIALCAVLPLAFHSVPQAGVIFSPMHIPVLLCGLVCSARYSAICGIIAPVASMLITGMPSAADVPSMMVELVCYGALTSLLISRLHTPHKMLNIYSSLIIPMIAGRVCAGLVKAFIFARGTLTIATWATAYFVKAIPGIILHLIIVPIIYLALGRAGLLTDRRVL